MSATHHCTGSIATYNCYGQTDSSMCWGCRHWSDPEKAGKDNHFVSTRDKLAVLDDFLQGVKLPDGVTCEMPSLSTDQATTVLWFLQVEMRCLPDNIERCTVCGELYDTDCGGIDLDDQYMLDGRELPKKYWGAYCGSCIPDVDWYLAGTRNEKVKA